MWKLISLREAKPGDLADHIHGLDSRKVTAIDADTNAVWIDILGKEAGPFPADNYEYLRAVE